MAKRRKQHQLSRGPWNSAHITKQFIRIGYRRVEHGRHPNYEHPGRSGKIQIPANWTGVKVGHETYKGLMRQSGFSKKELQRVLNGLDP